MKKRHDDIYPRRMERVGLLQLAGSVTAIAIGGVLALYVVGLAASAVFL